MVLPLLSSIFIGPPISPCRRCKLLIVLLEFDYGHWAVLTGGILRKTVGTLGDLGYRRTGGTLGYGSKAGGNFELP
jgi:hypothetical protein